jgi:hypothetical protein
MTTKLVAFADRGNSAYLTSHDFEGIINLIDGPPELFEEVAQSPVACARISRRNAGRCGVHPRSTMAKRG